MKARILKKSRSSRWKKRVPLLFGRLAVFAQKKSKLRRRECIIYCLAHVGGEVGERLGGS